jgi:Flp pilus assembly protein TadG
LDPHQVTRIRAYLRAQQGASTAEFAMVLPILLLLVLGLIHFGMLLFTATQLHWATEDAARCASVSLKCRVGEATGGAVTTATVQAWAAKRYHGLAAATFTYSATGTCSQTGGTPNGRLVTGSATYNINTGVFAKAMPLSASACFP